MVGIISVVIGGHFGGGDHFDGGDHFGGGTFRILPFTLLKTSFKLLDTDVLKTH